MREQSNLDKGQHMDNPAKSAPPITGKRKRKLKQKAEKQQQKAEKKEAAKGKRFGTVLTVMQAILTGAFLAILLILGIVPTVFFLGTLAVLLLLLLFTFKNRKKRGMAAVFSRILAMLMSLVLLCGCVTCGYLEYTLHSLQMGKGAPEIEVKERSFAIYINGSDGAIEEDQESDFHLLLVAQPKTKQAVLLQIPSEYYMTFPKISNGKRDLFGRASLHGMGAATEALGYLYETNIPFFVKVNLNGSRPTDLEGLAKAFAETVRKDPQNLLLGGVKEQIRTNLSKKQIADLVKMGSDKGWKVTHLHAEGQESSNYTFTNPKDLEFVITPSKDSVQMIVEVIDQLENSEAITLKQ